jgi:hypothetical protein
MCPACPLRNIFSTAGISHAVFHKLARQAFARREILYMRRQALTVALLLIFAANRVVAAESDSITLSSGTRIDGWIVRLTPESAFVLSDKQARKVPLTSATDLRFDLKSRPRCAVVNTAGRIVAVELSAYRNGLLEGKTSDGEKWSAELKEITSAEFYPTSQLSRTLAITHEKQKPDYCGEACVVMAAAYLGKRHTQDQVNTAGGLDGKRGVYSNELEKAISDLKLKSAPIAAAFPDRNTDDALLDRWRLIQAIDLGHPVLLGIWSDYENKSANFNFDHFVLLTGYDLATQAIIIDNPGGEKTWSRSFEQFDKHRRTKTNLVYQIEFPAPEKQK